MLRLGNTKSAAKDSNEPLIRLQKNGMKFTLGALSMLSLQVGDYVDIGSHEGNFWLAVTGREDGDGKKPAGKKVGKGNTFSSTAILSQLRGEISADIDVAYEITQDTLEMFEETWYRLAQAEPALGEMALPEDENQEQSPVELEEA